MRSLIFIVTIVVSFLLGFLVKERVLPDVSIGGAKQIRQGGYSFISPLLECEIGEKTLSKQIISFKDKLEDAVADLKRSEEISDMSVYFRDLNNGGWIGINEKEGFSPASLLKMPVMIAYYKEAEANPAILQKKLLYNDVDRNIIETVRPKENLKRGEEYVVEDLIQRMILESDNNSMVLLVQNMPLAIQNKVYIDLGITIPGVRGLEDYMSVTDNAAFFRILYNASYLSKSSSEKALKLLSRVSFDQAIRGGVPEGVLVANKFGERSFNGLQQLHDCGIVYYDDHPYLLCIMSRGNNFNELAKSIRKISALVYEEVDRQVKNPQE